MNTNIDAEVTIKFTIKDCIDQETLDEVFGGNLRAWIEELIKEDGIWSVVEDDFILLEVVKKEY